MLSTQQLSLAQTARTVRPTVNSPSNVLWERGIRLVGIDSRPQLEVFRINSHKFPTAPRTVAELKVVTVGQRWRLFSGIHWSLSHEFGVLFAPNTDINAKP